MGYRILNVSVETREAFTERVGLEGPFFYGGTVVLYYDPREGKWWNPHNDNYVDYGEYVQLTGQ